MAETEDKVGTKIGMWLFLYTEIMLFGGLFVLYAAYYNIYTADFLSGGAELSLTFGAVNTIILLCSSFAVAASITAIRLQAGKLVNWLLFSAVGLGILFLINKYMEWSHKIELGIYPGSESLSAGEPGRNIFFNLYYLITGLHGLHVLIGLILLCTCIVLIKKGRVDGENFVILDNCGLYWHLVDLIWIFVFPLFYLIV